MFDNFFSVFCIDFDCCIYLDPAKDSFKIKGYTEDYASDNHIKCFNKGQKVNRDHLDKETRYQVK